MLEGSDPVNWFNHAIWVAVITPSGRPKSVLNHCVIELFDGVFALSRCFLNFSVGAGAFVIETDSNLFLFLLFTDNTDIYSP